MPARNHLMKTCHVIIGLAAMVVAACAPTKDNAQPALPPATQQPAMPKEGPSATHPQEPEKPFVPRVPGRRVSRVSVPGPYVALTFDDGPSSSLTPQALDILKRNNAHATFFVLGENAERNKPILARAAAEGHEIGSHTYSHIKMTSVSDDRICRELERTNAAIQEATGRLPQVMRPPYGAVNARLVDMVYQNYGMSSVLWDVDTRDWQHPGVDVVVQRAVGGAKPGSVILLHDIHASTLAAVEGIVSGLQARGFKLVTVSQLIALGKHAAQEQAKPADMVAEPSRMPSLPLPQSSLARPGNTGSASIGVAPAPSQEAPQQSPAAASAYSGSSSLSGPSEE